MPRFHPVLAEWMRAHHGVVSSAQLDALCITTGERRAMLRCGELTVAHEGVYHHALWPDTMLSRCTAICLADPSLVICCGGAAHLWRFRQSVHIGLHAVSNRTTKPILHGVRLHRCPVLPASHVHERGDGIRVTSPARTVFDIARHLSPLALESVVEQGIDRLQFDIPTLQGVGALLCRQGRPGSELFRQVIDSRPAWRRPADSHPELLVRDALAALGVHLEPQVAVRLADGTVIHPDLADVRCGFYVEIDDHTWHGGRVASKRDAARDRSLRLSGGRVERVSTDELADLGQLARQLQQAHRQQTASALARSGAPSQRQSS